MIRLPSSVLALAALLAAQGPVTTPIVPTPASNPAPAVAPLVPAGSKTIDLAICLDISGSMDGLIDSARQNLWAVVNDLARLQPTPQLRVALLTFGCSAHDAEKGWVKVETDFTTDLDMVSLKLFALTTNGGDEYVARVVQAALGELQWTKEPGSLQLLFVAGNEAATQDPKVEAAAMSKAAITRGIVVNTIYCGDPMDQIAPGWREVAKLADGQFAAIQQDNSVAIPTPFDKQLQDLSASLNPTYVPYGAQRGTWAENQVAQDNNASVLNPAAAAQRCQTKASGLYNCAGWDLVDACDDPKFDLASVKKEDLDEALRKLSLVELKALVVAKKAQRVEIRTKVEAVGKQRDAFLAEELKKLGTAGEQRFEKVVLETVRAQAAAKGFTRKVEAAVDAAAQPKGDGKVVLDERFVPLIHAAAADYLTFVRVTGDVRTAPTDCRMAPKAVLRSQAEKEHGEKLYLLFARQAEGLEYLQPGVPAAPGQTLVKESWQSVPGEQTASTEASERHGRLLLREATGVAHAGAAAGLFVMHKLAADTPGTDQGWVYGTVDPKGVVTSAGVVASCVRCHQDATEDRRFGLR